MNIANLQRLIQLSSGLNPSHDSIEYALRQRRRITGSGESSAIMAAGSDELAALLELLVVPETWFFRDAPAFTMALQHVQSAMTQDRGQRPLRILCLPCSTGEEPYSMAMTLRAAGLSGRDVLIEAVDISAQALQKASLGVYQKNAFRGDAPVFQANYFSAEDGNWTVHAAVRDMVAYRQANLLTMEVASLNGRYDVIFCRNLLIYFDSATQQAAVARLHLMLADDGILLSGHAETLVFCRYYFESGCQPSAMVLRKQSTSNNKPVPPSARRVAPTRARATASVAATALPQRPSVVRVQSPALEALTQARALADHGAFDSARNQLHTLLREEPELAEAHFLLGLISAQGQNDSDAEKHLQRAIYLDPNHYDALCHLTMLARKRNDMVAAETLQKRATRVFDRQAAATATARQS